MLTMTIRTVKASLTALALAVFFSTPLAASPDSSLSNLERGLSDLIYRLSRSVVTVESNEIMSATAFGTPAHNSLRSLVASGLIVDSSGLILVAAATVANQDRISVEFDGRHLPATLRAIDYRYNLALLDVDEPIGTPITVSEKHSCAGQMVVAMGNAYGVRVAPSIGFCAGARDDGHLQFSIPVSSGTVGGGIFDLSGKFIGMIIGGMGERDHVAVAVPGFRIESTLDYLRTQGNRYAGFVGVRTAEIEIDPPIKITTRQTLIRGNSQPSTHIDGGVIITSVLSPSPAVTAGLRKGDVIYAIGNRQITTSTELSNLVRQLEPGMTVNVELIRNNTPFSLPLLVGRREAPSAAILTSDKGRTNNGPSPQTVDSLARQLEAFRDEILRLQQQLQDID